MCGIFGLISTNASLQTSVDLNSLLYHRGPDQQNVKQLRDSSVVLGHSRLSILDLSPFGAQPMSSHCGRYTIVYNGEIYNTSEIKNKLQRDWMGHSDTEVLIESISEWGIKKTLTLIKGMFAFAVFDSQEDKIYLARDRMGEKPLYYGFIDNGLIFSSELKPIISYPGFNKKISGKALAGYFAYSYVPGEISIFESIKKLKPAQVLEYSLTRKSVSLDSYWDIKDAYNKPKLEMSFQNSVEELEKLLFSSIQSQMVSDVPLGAFLSGGVDSSAIVALMQKNSLSKIKTFSIGFNEKNFNEAEYARAVANHIGTDHTELYITPQDALKVIPNLPNIYDEPFADSSQIPTFLLSQMTAKHVKVSLSGDAGDELFGGYNRYLLAGKIKKLNLMTPSLFVDALKTTLDFIPDSIWNTVRKGGADKIFKLKRVLGVKNENDIYEILVRHWGNDLMAVEPAIDFQSNRLIDSGSFQEKMMLQDCLTYLPDDILVKVDRAAMANSLETRVPFLDKDIVEFAMRLPLEHKIGTSSKMILREILYNYVPKHLIERPKMGFGVPIDSWLRKELKEWAEDLLSEKKLNHHGLLNASLIRSIWKQHSEGKANWQYYLWDVLMFQAWYDRMIK